MTDDRYFITGASGFIGMELTRILTGRQIPVTVLVRNPASVAHLPPEFLTVIKGDITDPESVKNAMKGCNKVFHLAAYARSFAEVPGIFDQVNVTGTENVLKAAVEHGIQRLVFTSTAGTFDISDAYNNQDERSIKPPRYNTEYARTKRMAELLCDEYGQKGLHVITVYPSRVYGPGVMSESNAVLRMLHLYALGKWRIIPSDGTTFGNYVFIDDVVNGHILAMQKGIPGEGYILGGENVTFNELFMTMRKVSGKTYRFYHIPLPVLVTAAAAMVAVARITRTRPLITPSWMRRYLQHRRLSSQKAIDELSYSITSLAQGFEKSLEWLKGRKL